MAERPMTIESLLKNWTSRGKTVARKGVALRCVSPAHMPERAPDDGRVYLPSGTTDALGIRFSFLMRFGASPEGGFLAVSFPHPPGTK